MDTLLTYLLLGLSCCARIQAANTTVNATSPTGNDTYSARLHCAESWSAYSASSSADVTYITSTVTSYDTTDAHLTYGTNKVYTTSNGIPVASGRFTRTSVVRTVLTITTTFEDIEGTTLHPSEVSATPTCSPPSPSECSMLYVSYLNSLGLPANASVPSVTPAPTNSPACPEYYYKPFSTCTTFLDTGADLGICSVIGANAKLFYFPTKTAGAAATATGDRGTITPTVVHSYAPGVTFTSPSVYLSFDTLSALSIVAGREYACTSCGWNGCQASAVGGGDALELIGTSTTGALLGEYLPDIIELDSLLNKPNSTSANRCLLAPSQLPSRASDERSQCHRPRPRRLRQRRERRPLRGRGLSPKGTGPQRPCPSGADGLLPQTQRSARVRQPLPGARV